MINVEKRKEEMINKNQFFKIKKGSEVMVVIKVLNPESGVEGDEWFNSTHKKDQLFHPSWLKGIHQCEECECEDSYNFRHMNTSFQQVVVKESDVEIVEGESV